MTVHRFLIEKTFIDLEQATVKLVNPKQVKQITRVLRLRKGNEIEVSDEMGNVHRIVLESLEEKEITGRIVASRLAKEKSTKLLVVLSLLKGGPFETALTKLTEIGVDKIIPVSTERTVVKLDQRETAQDGEKMRRWMSVIREATEQCERGRPPQMVPVQPLTEALNLLRSGDNAVEAFICTERSQAPHLVTTLYRRSFGKPSPAVPMSDICIVIGPEGGFTEQEIAFAISLGCMPCSLGDNILRADTAAIVAAGLVASFGVFFHAEQEYIVDTTSDMQ